jgi:opacity protein-like surface antigen
MTDPSRLFRRSLALALASILSTAALAGAQAPDFWFQRPNGSFGLYGGWWMPREESDLFEFVREQMTVQEGDFNSPLLGAEVALGLTDRVDAVLSVEGARGSRHSELRDWVENGLPIEQTTEFGWTRAVASGRLYLLPRGRTIGTHAWVPARWSPYVGAGGGVVWYTFEQFGDFVDFLTLDHPDGPEIFTDRIRSRGSGATTHALGGLEVSLTRNLVLRGEYRYTWGSAPVDSRSFGGGFDPIDLAGHRTTIGIATRF